jgi:hypothetical protein
MVILSMDYVGLETANRPRGAEYRPNGENASSASPDRRKAYALIEKCTLGSGRISRYPNLGTTVRTYDKNVTFLGQRICDGREVVEEPVRDKDNSQPLA